MKRIALALAFAFALQTAIAQSVSIHRDAVITVVRPALDLPEGFSPEQAIDSAMVVMVTMNHPTLALDNIYFHPEGRRESAFAAVEWFRPNGSPTASRGVYRGDTLYARCPLRQGVLQGLHEDSLLIMAFTYQPGGHSNPLDTVRLPLRQRVLPVDTVRVCDTAVHSYTLPDGTLATEDGTYRQADGRCVRLFFQPLLADTLETSTCEPFPWRDSLYAEEGLYQRRHPSPSGCDSLHTLILHTPPVNPLTISPGDSLTIRPGESVTLRASGRDYYWWYLGDSLLGSGPALTVLPTADTVYRVESLANTHYNLARNGDFEQGRTAFETDYYYSSNIRVEGCYMIGGNPHQYYNSFVALSNHTPGGSNYLMVNGGADTGAIVWQIHQAVLPHTSYAFSAWVSSISTQTTFDFQNRARLQFAVNGQPLGALFYSPANTRDWILAYRLWDSDTCTRATLTVMNLNDGSQGNDFGVDDISFDQLSCRGSAQVRVRILDSVPEPPNPPDTIPTPPNPPDTIPQPPTPPDTIPAPPIVTDSMLAADGCLWVPNSFTPGQGTNPLFLAKGYKIAHFEMYIYDRIGRWIWQTDNLMEGWDGTHRGTPQPQAAYVYLIRYSTETKPREIHTLTGTVTLLR